MYEINILVNGSRCKQYNHNGKTFIESKRGSEYVIEIKNETWKRILAVCSVDGLDILNGKSAKENGPGYVINGLNSSKFDGFRMSDDKVAKFEFDCKDNSYASSKEDGSERNVGVIGVRIFEEKLPPEPKEVHHHWNTPIVTHPPYKPYEPWGTPWHPPNYPYPTIWCSTMDSCLNGGTNTSCNTSGDLGDIKMTYLSNNIQSKGLSGSPLRNAPGASIKRTMLSMDTEKGTPRGFDMGTKWGEEKESRVVEVEFERGVLALTTNIYYASRQSLIEMGIPLGNEKQVSFPEPFVDSKYAKPPKNWKGKTS